MDDILPSSKTQSFRANATVALLQRPFGGWDLLLNSLLLAQESRRPFGAHCRMKDRPHMDMAESEWGPNVGEWALTSNGLNSA